MASRIKGVKGTFFALTEWGYDKENNYYPLNIKTGKIDGDELKENTWYELKNGEFIKAE